LIHIGSTRATIASTLNLHTYPICYDSVAEMVATGKTPSIMYRMALLVMGVPTGTSIKVLESTNRHIHQPDASHTTAQEQGDNYVGCVGPPSG